jgi:2TM domain
MTEHQQSAQQPWQPPQSPADQELRARALKRLKDKRDLKAHIVAYVTVNLMFVGIWAATGATFFWPVFPILGWGIGLAFHVWDVMSPEPGPREVEAEMERLRTRYP